MPAWLKRRCQYCGMCLCCFSGTCSASTIELHAHCYFLFVELLCFAQLQVTELPFFATKVRLGRTGAEEIFQLGPMNEYERYV